MLDPFFLLAQVLDHRCLEQRLCLLVLRALSMNSWKPRWPIQILNISFMLQTLAFCNFRRCFLHLHIERDVLLFAWDVRRGALRILEKRAMVRHDLKIVGAETNLNTQSCDCEPSKNCNLPLTCDCFYRHLRDQRLAPNASCCAVSAVGCGQLHPCQVRSPPWSILGRLRPFTFYFL